MSQLQPFVRAFRTLGASLQRRADNVRDGAAGPEPLERSRLLNDIGSAVLAAATDLEQQIATDIARLNQRDAEEVTPR